MEQRQYDVFISYSRKDYMDEQTKNVIPGSEVSKIKDALTSAGISFWMDEKGIIPGEDYAGKITRHIKACKIFVYISSEAANASEWTRKEIACALLYKKYLIPLRLDDSPFHDSVILRIADLDRIDYYLNPERGLEKLVRSVKSYLEEQAAEERRKKEEEERRREQERRKAEALRLQQEQEEKRLRQEQEELIRNIRLENEVLNVNETKLMADRKTLLLKAEKVRDAEKRAPLKQEIQESSPMARQHQEDRQALLRERDSLKETVQKGEEEGKAAALELKKRSEKITRLEQELKKAKKEAEESVSGYQVPKKIHLTYIGVLLGLALVAMYWIVRDERELVFHRNAERTLMSDWNQSNRNDSVKSTEKETDTPKAGILPIPHSATGRISIKSEPAGAAVEIDGKKYGVTPLMEIDLSAGQHQVKLQKEGYLEIEQAFKVKGGEMSEITLSLNSFSNASVSAMIIHPQYNQNDSTLYTAEGIFIVNGVTFKMIRVEGGTFMMGSPDNDTADTYDDEKPQHSVTLSDYYIGETEVTQALWTAVMGSNPSGIKGNENPVERVSWNKCQEFLKELNRQTGSHFRLPTEAEWEYAARGGSKEPGTKYAGSSTALKVAWYNVNSDHRTHPVKRKHPNELGLYDMSGNVREWCQDFYGDYSGESQTDPKGPNAGSHRVYRGGSWNTTVGSCRVSYRNKDLPTYSSSNLGLRLAL